MKQALSGLVNPKHVATMFAPCLVGIILFQRREHWHCLPISVGQKTTQVLTEQLVLMLLLQRHVLTSLVPVAIATINFVHVFYLLGNFQGIVNTHSHDYGKNNIQNIHHSISPIYKKTNKGIRTFITIYARKYVFY